MDKIVCNDGDEVSLQLSSTLTLTYYQLFVNNNEISYSVNYGEGIQFTAAYADGKDGDIYLKHKENGTIVKGPQLLVKRSYSFFRHGAQIANEAGSLFLDDEDYVYGNFRIFEEVLFKSNSSVFFHNWPIINIL